MLPAIKLSAPETGQFWEIPVLHLDDALLALNKPAGVNTAPGPFDAGRPNLLSLLHQAVADAKPWVKESGISFLQNANRLEFETSGVLLFARSKPVAQQLADVFGANQTRVACLALVHGAPADESFETSAKIAPDPGTPGKMRIDRRGKNARTKFEVAERFEGWTLLRCFPLTSRPHQVQLHLRLARLPLVSDAVYGTRPLLLSKLKPGYRGKPGADEKPLIARPALHVERLEIPHPASGSALSIEAPPPKDFEVALKYLRRFASAPPTAPANLKS